MTLGERKLKILAAVVEAYIATGEPVGSKTICEMMGNTVSSATIRNEMADLVEKGVLEQPHTSAGRVPSPLGYRIYINQLMGDPVLPEKEKNWIDAMLAEADSDPEKILGDASQALAAATQFAAMMTTPSGEDAVVRSIQLVPTGRRTALIVLMTSSGVMKNRLCRCDFDLTPELLRVISRLLGEKISGKPLREITLAYMQTLAASLGELTFMISPVLMAVYEAVKEASASDVCLEGQANLLIHPEFDGSHVRRIIEFLNHRAEVANLLNRNHGGVHIMIGPENGRPELVDSSLVVAKYAINGKEAGAIGIIGPTRMNYAHVIASVEYLTDSVGKLLTELLHSDE